MQKFKIPNGHESSKIIVSVSGGKDSTALACALMMSGIECVFVFADTGWEFPQTYEYVDVLERALGQKIHRVGKPGGMRSAVSGGARFPSRVQRWCTRELKVEPLREFHDRIAEEFDCDTINAVGIRADESAARAELPEFEYSDKWGGYIWRPLIRWSVADVLAMHHKFGVPVNPLYRMGFSRVGCFCINASKEEIKLTAEHFPERIDELDAMEREGSAERARRNVDDPGRYTIETATFFQKTVPALNADGTPIIGENGKPKRTGVPFPIREAVAWSKTARGGREVTQLSLIREDPDGGCFRWGMCEPPAKESE